MKMTNKEIKERKNYNWNIVEMRCNKRIFYFSRTEKNNDDHVTFLRAWCEVDTFLALYWLGEMSKDFFLLKKLLRLPKRSWKVSFFNRIYGFLRRCVHHHIYFYLSVRFLLLQALKRPTNNKRQIFSWVIPAVCCV